MSSTVRVRIAPSPTGDPHVGTAYIGLLNYIYAKQRGGKFILRIEDTDRTRFVPTSEAMIFEALRWLGVDWDEGPDVGGPHGPYRQSERTEIYRAHTATLIENGSAYRCFCTPEELDQRRKAQLAAKMAPRYDGTCRRLTKEQIDANLAAGKPFTVRLAVPTEGATVFRDELRGEITIDHHNVDDQVLMKSDGFPTYHLANVVDDHLMEITDVIRAEEWISSTPKHVLLYKAFGWELPKFWHMPLLRNTDKSKISKRKNPVSLIYYRQAGFLPQAMLNFLGLMGGGMPAPGDHNNTPEQNRAAEIFSMADMLERFVFERISLGGPVFDLVKLKWLNGEYIRALSKEEFARQMREVVFSDEFLVKLTPLVQNRVETLAQVGDIADFLFKDNVVPAEDVWMPKKRSREDALAFTGDLLTALEGAEWEEPAIDAAIRALLTAKEWSVKEGFTLLRTIITGTASSPPLLESLVIFGKARSLDRVRRFLDAQKKLSR